MNRLGDAFRWLQARLNIQLTPVRPEREFWRLFASGGRTLEGPPATLMNAAASATDLLIVLTTYNRPDSCGRSLGALPELIANAGRPLRVQVVVAKDAEGAPYTTVEAAARASLGDRLSWLEARARLGKQGFWKTYQVLFQAARQLRPAHLLFLQDDLEFAPTLLAECYRRFAALEPGEGPRVLYLFAGEDDESHGRWIRFERRQVSPEARLTRWFDLQAFFLNRAVLELLRYRMFPVFESRWRKRPHSSGVGKQLTRRLFGRANVYQAVPSLVFHGAHESEMNPDARAARRLDNRPGPVS